MTGRIAAAQVRSPTAAQQAPSASKSKAGQQAAQTVGAGWRGGARASGLKITSAVVGEGPKTSDKILVPRGYTASVKHLTNKSTDTVHGQKVAFEQSAQQLTLTGPGGKKLNVGKSGDFAGLAKEWKDEVKAAKAEPKNEYLMLDWDSSQSTQGVGTAGKLFSVSDSAGDFMGGAHPNNATALATYDASTGAQVKLDSLLTQQQMSSLVKDIGTKLGKLKGEDGIDGSAFDLGGDKAALRDVINNNFALTTDKSGKVQIHVAWESGIHALGGQMAHFTLDAPTSPAFKAKLGLESTAR